MGSPRLKKIIGKNVTWLRRVDHDALREIMRCSNPPSCEGIIFITPPILQRPLQLVAIGIYSVVCIVKRGRDHDIANFFHRVFLLTLPPTNSSTTELSTLVPDVRIIPSSWVVRNSRRTSKLVPLSNFSSVGIKRCEFMEMSQICYFQQNYLTFRMLQVIPINLRQQ